MNTSEILHKAADLIEERGWVTGSWGHGDSPLCIEGALAAASGWRDEDRTIVGESCPAYSAVTDYLNLDRNSLYYWNDRRARNAAEVIEVLRGAAAVEQLREAGRAAIEEARETARGPLGDAPPVKFPAPETAGLGA